MNHIEKEYDQLKKILARLQEAENLRAMMHDSLIKRYELTITLFWRYLR